MQSDEIRRRLGESIKAFRESQGWSQTELAERLGAQLGKAVDPTTITRMERGSRPTTVDELYALSATFSTSPLSLIPGTGAIDRLVADYEVDAKYREAEVVRLRSEIHRANYMSRVSRVVRDASQELLLAKQTGQMSAVPGAVVNMAAMMDRFGGYTTEIPLTAIFRELGVPEESIAAAETPANGYLRFVGKVLESAFPREWMDFSEEMDNLEAFAAGETEDEA